MRRTLARLVVGNVCRHRRRHRCRRGGRAELCQHIYTCWVGWLAGLAFVRVLARFGWERNVQRKVK